MLKRKIKPWDMLSDFQQMVDHMFEQHHPHDQ